jgi:hypothetical protein
MEIMIKRRELLLLSPGNVWDLPDEIAEELIRRGAAVISKPQDDKPKKPSLKGDLK